MPDIELAAVLDIFPYFCLHISTGSGNGEESESVSAPMSGVVSSFNVHHCISHT